MSGKHRMYSKYFTHTHNLRSRRRIRGISGPVLHVDGRVFFTSLLFDLENSGDKTCCLYRMQSNEKNLGELTTIRA